MEMLQLFLCDIENSANVEKVWAKILRSTLSFKQEERDGKRKTVSYGLENKTRSLSSAYFARPIVKSKGKKKVFNSC